VTHRWPPGRGVRAAFTFLTRIPVGGFPYADADWRWSSAHFPLVGAVVGAIMAAVHELAAPAGAAPAAVLAVIAGLLVTGGFHEDGLADTADALGGGHDRARILDILKDSRIGAFGGLALASSLLLRAALIAELGALAAAAVIVAQCVSRAPPVWLLATQPYLTDEAHRKSGSVARSGPAQAAVATGWAAIAVVALVAARWLGATQALVAVGAATVAGVACGVYFRRRVGGVTGDFLGACQQVTEAAVLVAIACARTWP